MMSILTQRIEGGIYGLLVGDACGVPYEFRRPQELPPLNQLEMQPPNGFLRTYAHIPLGTWSDDGAQALCLLASLIECRSFHPYDFARCLVRWHDEGYMAIDHYVFDIGNQTSVSIQRLKRGMTLDYSGMAGVRNNGNGSLMRVLPLALLHRGNDASLIVDAQRQSRVTHAHLRSQICCALYCLWARRELEKHSNPWESALETARIHYAPSKLATAELENHILIETQPTGTGYVVDALKSALYACQGDCYKSIVQRAIALGNDTDTTACIAGGIAGIRYGKQGIPEDWYAMLRGKSIVETLLSSIWTCRNFATK